MKVLIINQVFNKNLYKQSRKSNPIKNNSINNSPLNINEALGRAQVGFTSLFKPTPSGYEYENDGLDKISYNKEKGSFAYNNNEKSVVYDPKTGIETTTITRKDSVEIIKNSKQQQTKKIVDKQGDIIYLYRKNNITGDYQEYTKDKNLQREIYTNMQNGIKDTRVLDLKTGNYVTQGRLTWVDEVDDENNMIVTKNAVTNAIIQEKSTNPNNPFLRKYDEEKDYLTFETYFDKKIRLFVAKGYYESGITSFVQTYTKDASFVEIKRHDEQDEEIDHVIITGKGKNKTTQVFYPNTNKIHYIRQDYVNKKTSKAEYSIKEYKRFPNIAQSEKTYILDSNFLTKETLFHEDGESPALIISHDEDGSRREEARDKDNNLKTIEIFNSDNFMTSHLEYITENKFIIPRTRLYKAIDYDPETGKQQEYYYDDDGKFYSTHYLKDKNGNLLEKAKYFANSNDINILYEYYDGICTKTTFNKNGDIVDIEQTPYKNTEEQEEASEGEELEDQFRIIPIKTHSKENPDNDAITDESVIKKIADRIDNQGNIFRITDEEWQAVLKEFDLKNFNELDELTDSGFQKIYKKLISKTNSENIDKMKNLISILQFFYKN